MNIDVHNILILSCVFFSSIGLTWIVLKNSAGLKLIQVPNARSSHTLPTPSGGGVAAAAASLVAAPMLVPPNGYAVLAVVVCVCATLLGFLDDRFDLPSKLRFGFHVLFAGALALSLQDSIWFGDGWSPLQVGVMGLLILGGVWWINLFNFMDGIDGLAGSQSVFMLLAGVSLAVSGNGGALDWMGWWSLAICASVLGFLILNWPPAKIFMGDAGSNFLAAAILAIFLWFQHEGLVGAPSLLLIIALFTSDATVTLLRRIIAREAWWSAHRQHAYQRLSQACGRHLPVTLMYLAIDVVWLYPCAYIAAMLPDISWLVVTVGYLPVVIFIVLGGTMPSSPTV